MHAKELVNSYFDAWNQRDANAIAEHFTHNGMYCDVPSNVKNNRQQLVHSLSNLFCCEDNKYRVAGEILYTDKTIAFQYNVISLDRNIDDRLGAVFIRHNKTGVISLSDYYDLSLAAYSTFGILDKKPAPKYARSGLSDARMEKFLSKLNALMVSDKIYLDSDITLKKLALRVDCSVNHLSQIINAGFGMKYFDLLQYYRIDDAKKMLEKNDSRISSMLDIAYNSGFNSHSAFYLAFKKLTGKTPAQYRRDHQLKKTKVNN